VGSDIKNLTVTPHQYTNRTIGASDIEDVRVIVTQKYVLATLF